MMPDLAQVVAAASGPAHGIVDAAGKWVFIGTLGVLVLWLWLVPRRFIGQAAGPPPWWRNVRVWAVVVALLQLWVYLYWG